LITSTFSRCNPNPCPPRCITPRPPGSTRWMLRNGRRDIHQASASVFAHLGLARACGSRPGEDSVYDRRLSTCQRACPARGGQGSIGRRGSRPAGNRLPLCSTRAAYLTAPIRRVNRLGRVT